MIKYTKCAKSQSKIALALTNGMQIVPSNVQAYALLLVHCWPWCVAAERAPRIALLSMSTGVMAKPYMAQTVVNKAMYASFNKLCTIGVRLTESIQGFCVFWAMASPTWP